MARRGIIAGARASVRRQFGRAGARLTRGARRLLERRDFFEAFTEQLRLGETFQRAAAEVWRVFRDLLPIRFQDVQIAGSRVRRARLLAEMAQEQGLGRALRVRDFFLVPQFQDVIGRRSRFVVGLLLDAQQLGLQGGMLRIPLEFDRPPSLADILRRIDEGELGSTDRPEGRSPPLGEALREITVPLSAIDLEYLIRLW